LLLKNTLKGRTELAWSLIRNKKPIVLFEKHCHATEKSEAIACARRCRPSRLTRWWTKKNNWKKMEGRGGGKAQGVADTPPPKKVVLNFDHHPKVRSFGVQLQPTFDIKAVTYFDLTV
jgi:hypothetical protein